MSSGEAEDIDNVIFLAFSSSFWIPDDTEDHNICMIEESGPLSASYQIHQCNQDGQKPVAWCHISDLELDHGSQLLSVTFLSLTIFVFSMLSSLTDQFVVFLFLIYSLKNYLQISVVFGLWLFSCLIVSVEMALYILCCIYSETQYIYCPCQITIV